LRNYKGTANAKFKCLRISFGFLTGSFLYSQTPTVFPCL